MIWMTLALAAPVCADSTTNDAVGARLGLNVGYLKLTPMPTWNPF